MQRVAITIVLLALLCGLVMLGVNAAQVYIKRDIPGYWKGKP